MRRRKQAHAELTAAVDRGTGEETAQLIRIASAPLFQHALAQAGPALLDEVRKAAVRDRGELRRRTLIGLTKFVSRAATKTSPYSTFTAIARGTWTPTPDGARSTASAGIRCVTELDRMVLDQITAALLADDALVADLRVRPNPSLTTTGTGHLFLGRRPDESLVSLPFSAAVETALELGHQGCTVAELRARLATLSGGQETSAAAYCRRLLDLGVLEHVSPVPDQSEQPLADLIGFLEAASDHDHAPLLEQLRRLDRTVRRPVAPTDVDGVRGRQRTAVAGLSEIGRTLDLDWPAPDVLGKFAFHENAVVPDSGLTAATSEWRPLLTDLDALRRWLGLHDRMLPVRIALSEYVRRRFGPQAPVGLVALHARLQQDLSNRPWPPPPTAIPSGSPRCAPSCNSATRSRRRS
uniref:lantibiotic dehydratase n=1 Tax=Nocardiopsis xinjiangensis TaxID=124285 RepID=UPI001377F849|nr:lantibiotic dehydratase [Nocardiopsis xinjiangensis]